MDINVAISNPCFEVWILLHQDKFPSLTYNRGQYKSLLTKLLGGYDKSNYNIERIIPMIPNAISYAENRDINDNYPSILGTYVHRLVRKLFIQK